MIFRESLLICADNSGARKLKCVNIIGKFGTPHVAYMGDTLVVVVQSLDVSKKIKKRVIYYAILISTIQQTRRKDGSYIRFFINRVLLFNTVTQEKFLGTRVDGCLSREAKFRLANKKHKKLLSYVGGVI
jgi:large subunit ribosomal protein L14